MNERSLRKKFEDLETLSVMHHCPRGWNLKRHGWTRQTEVSLLSMACQFAQYLGVKGKAESAEVLRILYAHNSVRAVSVIIKTIAEVDAVFTEMKNKSYKIMISLIYRPP